MWVDPVTGACGSGSAFGHAGLVRLSRLFVLGRLAPGKPYFLESPGQLIHSPQPLPASTGSAESRSQAAARPAGHHRWLWLLPLETDSAEGPRRGVDAAYAKCSITTPPSCTRPASKSSSVQVPCHGNRGPAAEPGLPGQWRPAWLSRQRQELQWHT